MKKKKDKRGHRCRLPIELEHKLPTDVLRHIYSFLFVKKPNLLEQISLNIAETMRLCKELDDEIQELKNRINHLADVRLLRWEEIEAED